MTGSTLDITASPKSIRLDGGWLSVQRLDGNCLSFFCVALCTAGKMSTEAAGNRTSPAPHLLGLLVSTTKLIPPSPTSPEMTDPLPVIIVLVCILLILATFLIFFTLCKPVALDQSRFGPHECMPHHLTDASEPQLRLWKRLGSLRRSISTFRRSWPVSQSQLAGPRSSHASQDWDVMESTKM